MLLQQAQEAAMQRSRASEETTQKALVGSWRSRPTASDRAGTWSPRCAETALSGRTRFSSPEIPHGPERGALRPPLACRYRVRAAATGARERVERVFPQHSGAARILRPDRHPRSGWTKRACATTADAQPAASDQYGDRFVIEFEIRGPLGSGVIKSAWIVRRGERAPRLTSCFVK